MNLDRAVGQLITGKVSGYELDSEYAALISSGTMSGVTLFKDNARDLPQLIALVEKCLTLGGGSKEFWVMVDQEGGAVQRFDEVLTPFPSAMALASQDDLGAIGELMSASARQLRLLGVNCVLAPVLDLNSNARNPIIGTRSYGAARKRIVDVARVVAKAYSAEGVMPVGKHFPGHGDTLQDSHLALAVVHCDQQTLQERELYPFRQFGAGSDGELPAMLIGHIWLTEVDEEPLPATMSERVIEKMLREEIGFDGYLISDDMPVMRAIVDNWGLEEAAVMAVKAGLDNLLISGTSEQIKSVHAALLAAVNAGEISETRLNSALKRRKHALSKVSNERPASLADRERELRKEVEVANVLSEAISSKTHCLVRGVIPNLVTHSAEWVIVVPDHPRYPMDLLGEFAQHLPPGAPALHERRYSLAPSAEEIADVVTFIGNRRCLLVTFRALVNDRQLNLAHAIMQASGSMEGLLVASDVPYELVDLQEWPNAIATFDPSNLAMKTLGAILANKASAPLGRLSLAACPIT